MQGYKDGYAYHIKDSYFAKANDDKLMRNKENGNYRPTYYCLKDEKTSLLWVVPISSQAEKYEKLIEKITKRYGEALGIYVDVFDGKKAAFLVQNMFPITEKYIDHIHTRNGNPVTIKPTIQNEIKSRVNKSRRLVARGINVVFPDIKRLEKLMLDEIATEKSAQSQTVTDKQTANQPTEQKSVKKNEPLFSRSKLMSDEFKPTSTKEKGEISQDKSKKHISEL